MTCAALTGGNPIPRVKRHRIDTNEGKTPALNDHQIKAVLDAPDATTLKDLRGRAILALLLYHGLRREEATQLLLHHLMERRGIKHLVILGKDDKIRYQPLHLMAMDRLYADYNRASGFS